MASAQVLRKQEHLEAGKRRLEEFRKKKAAERAKKAGSTSQTHVSDDSPHEKQLVDTDPVRLTDSDGAGTSDEPGRAVLGSSAAVSDNDNKAIVCKNMQIIKNLRDTVSSGFAGSMDVNHRHEMEGLNNEFGIYTGVQDSIPPTTNVRGSAPEAWQHVNGIAHTNDSIIFDYGERKLSSSAGAFPSVNNSAVQAWEATGFSSDVRSSSNHVPLSSVTPETTSRRSRPSFLDSLNMPRASSGTLFQRTEPEESFMSSSLNDEQHGCLRILSFSEAISRD
uniref:Uncharacterized protein n=1 Tax=Fagus sylvatica TaxID=28930 RepID=A0A2N9IGK0_FAGSY